MIMLNQVIQEATLAEEEESMALIATNEVTA
jgi:hypothetical protein